MKEFFKMSNFDVSYGINIYEKYIPIVFTIIILIILYYFRNEITPNKIFDRYIRYIMCGTQAIFLTLYYLLEWNSNGIRVYNLPLHICFISCILSIILCFNSSKKLFNFLVFAGVLGGISSLIAPAYDLSYKYFRYYQFMTCHMLIIIIPFYYIFVHKYEVSFKESINVILQIEILGILLGVFNEFFNTNYMFVSFSSNKAAKDSILYSLGSGYDYFIKLQFLFLIAMFIWYYFLKCINYFSLYRLKYNELFSLK